MLAIVTIIIIGAGAALIMMLAASLLASQISSMESDYTIEEDLVSNPDSSTIEASP